MKGAMVAVHAFMAMVWGLTTANSYGRADDDIRYTMVVFFAMHAFSVLALLRR